MNKQSLLRKAIFLVFFIVGISILGWQCLGMRQTAVQFLDREGKAHTLRLSIAERKRLLDLMELLFARDSFAYTLLGSKPVSWACYIRPFPFVNFSLFRDSWHRYHRTLHLGWEVWSKYRHAFPFLAFWAEPSKANPARVSIFILNEARFNEVVKENSRDFQTVLHRDVVDGYQLLREAEPFSLQDVLQGHQALIGIVLGYGRNNAWEFQKRSERREVLGCVWDTLEDQGHEGIRTRAGAQNIEEHLALDSCPSFAGDPFSAESLLLKEDYLRTRQRVIDYYKDKDFLEATLSLLAGFRPKSD